MAGVGLVVVSHSRPLARAAVALAGEMPHGGQVRIEIAAGLDDGSLGTDAVAIVDAVTRADGGDGVVVLMDLGSAVLSAELALDLLDPSARDRVLLCPAPLVEGLVGAVVAAGGGAGRAEVAAEALAALAGKQAQLGGPTATEAPGPEPDALVGTFTVTGRHGLHARPAALLVQAVRSLDATVQLRNLTTAGPPVPAASLSRVATLGALAGHDVEVRAAGPQAREALDHVLALAAGGFGEGAAGRNGTSGDGPAWPGAAGPAAGPGATGAFPADPGSGGPVPEGRGPGGPGRDRSRPVGASPGVAVGPVRFLARQRAVPIVDPGAGEPAAEWRRLREAIAAVRREVRQVRGRTAHDVGEAEAAIFDAHLLLLDDPELIGDARGRIEAGRAAGAAWSESVDAAAGALAALPDPYLQARAADVRAVGDHVRHRLAGGAATDAPAGDGVLVAADLTPAEAAGLDPARVAAVVLAYGSATAHSAILVRARGIPAVVGAGREVLDLVPGTEVAVDGGTGELVVDPAADVRGAFRERASRRAERRARAAARAGAGAVTADGTAVPVGANIGSVADARDAAAAGADHAGLVRTEFLFLDRATPPDVDEQVAVYRDIAAALPGRRVVLRTLDVGGDKPLAYLPRPAEANPFLGVRGIRLSLARPELLADQLRAAVLVAHEHPVDVMFPMVSTTAELAAARRVLDGAVSAVGRGHPPGMRVGIMVEVPAAALKAASFGVDFLSVGTNDLTQYALAAERGNDAVAAVADPLDPGVLALVAAAGRAACPVAVCGELAADELATPLLLGLGVRELSVAPAAVAEIKEAVRAVDLAAATRLASRALAAPDADAVRALLAGA